MRNARVSRFSVLLSAGTVVSSALAVMLTSGIAFAGGTPDIDTTMDLPMDAPVKGAPHRSVTASPAPSPAPTPGDIQKPEFFGHDIETNNSIVYVIDQSGSMSLSVASFTDENGNVVSNGTRMARAKSELKKSIASLPTTFTFNVFFYDECIRPWQGHNVPATDANKAAADKFIDSQGPMGFTNTGLAVASALQDKTNMEVVLLSDGEPNFLDCAATYVGSFQDHRDMIKEANTQHARVDCFGIGVAADPNARQFMQQVAADNNGTYIECN